MSTKKFFGGRVRKTRTRRRKRQTRKGQGVYLKPYPRTGCGYRKKKHQASEKYQMVITERLPLRPLSNIELAHFTAGISDFRGVFMRDALPRRIRRIILLPRRIPI